MIPVLIADIGGTNSRINLIEIERKNNLLKSKEIDKFVYKTYNYSSLENILMNFLEKYKNTTKYPQLAVIGIPTEVLNNKVMKILCFPSLSNKTGEEIAKVIGINKLIFLNDFVLNGYSIQSNRLKEGIDYITINPEVEPLQNMSKVLIGPGTGLGISFMTKSPNEKYYTVHSSGGCGLNFAPNNELQAKLRKFLINEYKSYNIDNPDIGLLCRGPTIIEIMKFLSKEEKIEGTTEIMSMIKDSGEDKDKLNELNKLIVKYGIENICPLCKKTIDFYIEIFGYICANIALIFLPYGGLFLMGGVTAAIAHYIKENKIFLDNFTRKNKSILEKIPIYAVLNTDLGLEGATLYAKKYIEEEKI